MSDKRMNATYLVDQQYLLHLREKQDSVVYACFNKNDRQEAFTGSLSYDAIGESPVRGFAAAARQLAIQEIGLSGNTAAVVASSMLEQFPAGRRLLYQEKKEHPDEPDAKAIRFISSRYEEKFRIPDGGVVEITFPHRTFAQKCEYLDDYHLRLGYDVLHICQLAEMLERGNGSCCPEPLCMEEEAAWELGRKGYLALQTCEDGYDYTIYDRNFNDLDGGQLDMPELSMNEARNAILEEYGWSSVAMVRIDYDSLLEKAEERGAEKRESVLGKLSSLDGRSSGSPVQKEKENER